LKAEPLKQKQPQLTNDDYKDDSRIYDLDGFGVDRLGQRFKSCLECAERRKAKAEQKKASAEIKCIDDASPSNNVDKRCIMCSWKEGNKPLFVNVAHQFYNTI
jgi:hypothetical protein